MKTWIVSSLDEETIQGEETNQGRKLYEEIRYIDKTRQIVASISMTSQFHKFSYACNFWRFFLSIGTWSSVDRRFPQLETSLDTSPWCIWNCRMLTSPYLTASTSLLKERFKTYGLWKKVKKSQKEFVVSSMPPKKANKFFPDFLTQPLKWVESIFFSRFAN